MIKVIQLIEDTKIYYNSDKHYKLNFYSLIFQTLIIKKYSLINKGNKEENFLKERKYEIQQFFNYLI